MRKCGCYSRPHRRDEAVSDKDLGFNSPVCTWPRCRQALDYGSAVQIVIDGGEHRLCSKHHSLHMNEGENP